jgi:rod shape-determining protein MreC
VTAGQGSADRVENRRLNALLKLPWGGDPIPSVIARVTDTGAGNYNRLITLSRGSESGIHAGMPVVASGGLVGRVWQAWNGGASVLLLDDPDFGVGVRMVTHRNVDIAKGQAGRSTLLVQLTGPLSPRSRPTRGEIVITSGQDDASQFPPGIPIGRVVSTSVNDDGLAIDTIVAPYVDFSSLEYVRVLQWKPGSPVPAKLRATTTVPTTTTTTTSTTVPGATTTTSTSGTTSTTGP